MGSIRQIFVITCLLVITGLIWAGIYARKQGFTNSWRVAVEKELATQGYYVDIGKLTLGAFRGLVAEDVNLYSDEERSLKFAEIKDIYLDVGLENVLNKEISINTLDIEDGRLTIPLNPNQPKSSPPVQITDLSGRVALTESRIEVSRWEAKFAGIDLQLKGSFLRSQNPEANQIEQTGKQAIDATIARISLFTNLIETINSFEFPDGAPLIKVDFQGDLGDLSRTTAHAVIEAPAFRRKNGDYQVSSLSVVAGYDGRIKQIKIPKLALNDRQGVFDADGTLDLSSNKIDFEVHSDADLINLLEFFFPTKKWGEVVFYQSPKVVAEGTIDLASINSDHPDIYFPGVILGEFETERFASSSVVFSASKGRFSVKNDKFYIRNLLVEHKTGVALFNCKFDPENKDDALQFNCGVEMDPRVFAPFLKDEDTRRFLRKWSFSSDSEVLLQAAGRSSSLNFDDIESKGEIHLTNFKLNKVPFQRLDTTFDTKGSERWYRNVTLTRSDGVIEAPLAYTNAEKRVWEIKGGRSSVGLLEGFAAFSPILKEKLSPYRFSSPPRIDFQGTIDSRSTVEKKTTPSRHDLEVTFSSPGSLNYQFLGSELPLNSPEGSIYLDGDEVHLHAFTARLCGGDIEMEFQSPDLLSPQMQYTTTLTATDIGLKSLGSLYEFGAEARGSINAELVLNGQSPGFNAANGSGSITISDNDLFHIPAASGLEELLISMEPSHARNNRSAEQSSANFTIKDGSFISDDLKIVPGSADLRGNAVINIPDQTVEVELSPASDSLNRVYQCKGGLKAPEWKVITGRRFTTISKR